jgi:hypothetical protein
LKTIKIRIDFFGCLDSPGPNAVFLLNGELCGKVGDDDVRKAA